MNDNVEVLEEAVAAAELFIYGLLFLMRQKDADLLTERAELGAVAVMKNMDDAVSLLQN